MCPSSRVFETMAVSMAARPWSAPSSRRQAVNLSGGRYGRRRRACRPCRSSPMPHERWTPSRAPAVRSPVPAALDLPGPTGSAAALLVTPKSQQRRNLTQDPRFPIGLSRARPIHTHTTMNSWKRKFAASRCSLALLLLVATSGGACSSSGSDQSGAKITSAPADSSAGASASVPASPSPQSTHESSSGDLPGSATPAATMSPTSEQSSGGTSATSGSSQSTGDRDTGSASAGGSGGSDPGGSDPGGSDPGGASAGGSGGVSGAGDVSAGATGGASAGGDDGTENGGSDDDVVLSAGCNVADGPDVLTVGGSSVPRGLPTSTRLSINSGGTNREYIVDIPADYDPAHPYRLVFSWHQAFGSAEGNANGLYPANDGPNFDAEHYAFFGLHREATEANDPVIFVAPQGIGNFPWDYERDVALFDALLTLVTDNLCIDESRVFTTGFSFGAMMSHALSIGRASKLRGAVTMAAANYNFTQPTNDNTPIAYFGITGMSDGTCPWVNSDQQRTGGKYCVLTHAENNGCTVAENIQTAMMGGRDHLCFDFDGCQAGYPVKVCTFDGGHTPSSVSDGMSGGDDGLKAFIPPLAWEFISQL